MLSPWPGATNSFAEAGRGNRPSSEVFLGGAEFERLDRPVGGSARVMPESANSSFRTTFTDVSVVVWVLAHSDWMHPRSACTVIT